MKPTSNLTDDEFVRLVRGAVALPDAPAGLVDAAIGLWPRRQQAAPMREVATAAWRLVQAVLSFDSWAQPALAAGVRSAATDTRHLLFNAQGRDVDLRIRAQGGTWVLTGQVLGPDEQGLVELHGQGSAADAEVPDRVTALDELGEFRIDNVRGGSYTLTLRVGQDRIVLPAIEVGE
ncbi:MAG: hypothetical protein RLZZ584_4053 [Pseudomonadota bacterium]|jgi:hypothetical protein